jgi:hypothetical protein
MYLEPTLYVIMVNIIIVMLDLQACFVIPLKKWIPPP